MAGRGPRKYPLNREDQFLTDIQIVKRPDENCDHERSIDAVIKYVSYYEYYNDWLIKGKINKGWDLWNNELQLKISADILTSITKPFLCCVNKTTLKCKKGEEIREYLLNTPKEDSVVKEEILPYIRAFAAVYYSLGNMMPTIRNFSPNVKNRNGRYETLDNWNYKLNYIKDNLQKTGLTELRTSKNTNALWGPWIAELWGDTDEGFTEFLKANYLCDVWDAESCRIKPIVSSCGDPAQTITNLDSDAFTDHPEIDFNTFAKEWFADNIKIIIQRSYRILQQNNSELSKAEKDFILKIFKLINDKYGTELSPKLF